MASISKNLTEILKRIEDVHRMAPCASPRLPRLVAVSKEKPISAIIEAYNAGQHVFGENRVASLLEKSSAPDVIMHCPNIKWHFIGHIQSNKIMKLASVLNLSVVETLESLHHAVLLDSAWTKVHDAPLNVMLQVNTSGELQKGGVDPRGLTELYKSVIMSCPHLNIIGLMCIGRSGHDNNVEPNPDFLRLSNCRKDLCGEIGLNTSDLELSMGMSDDFEHAITLGSTNVRVGTSIFGQRAP